MANKKRSRESLFWPSSQTSSASSLIPDNMHSRVAPNVSQQSLVLDNMHSRMSPIIRPESSISNRPAPPSAAIQVLSPGILDPPAPSLRPSSASELQSDIYLGSPRLSTLTRRDRPATFSPSEAHEESPSEATTPPIRSASQQRIRRTSFNRIRRDARGHPVSPGPNSCAASSNVTGGDASVPPTSTCSSLHSVAFQSTRVEYFHLTNFIITPDAHPGLRIVMEQLQKINGESMTVQANDPAIFADVYTGTDQLVIGIREVDGQGPSFAISACRHAGGPMIPILAFRFGRDGRPIIHNVDQDSPKFVRRLAPTEPSPGPPVLEMTRGIALNNGVLRVLWRGVEILEIRILSRDPSGWNPPPTKPADRKRGPRDPPPPGAGTAGGPSFSGPRLVEIAD